MFYVSEQTNSAGTVLGPDPVGTSLISHVNVSWCTRGATGRRRKDVLRHSFVNASNMKAAHAKAGWLQGAMSARV